MSAATLIADLERHGTRVAVAGERVRLVHPAGRPPPAALIRAAREAKSELREALTAIHSEILPAYAEALGRLERERPDGVSEARGRVALGDARRFLCAWG
jgi:hypothetical protein